MTATTKTRAPRHRRKGRAKPAPRSDIRERLLFDSLRGGGRDTILARTLLNTLRRAGLRLDDPRLADSVARLEPDDELDHERFREVIKPSLLVIERALQGNLVIPDFDLFRDHIDGIYERTLANDSGAVANYIPQLARVNPDAYGVALCSVDGQRHALGDADVEFSVQSTCKPIQYCLALEEHGPEQVHARIGCEPSGLSFNELSLNRNGLPHNPMINSGAIVASSMIRPGHSTDERFEYVMQRWTELAGGRKPGFSNPTYLSERRTADRNFALGYMMREHGGFPAGTDLVETLEFFFQCCSIEATAQIMSVVAGTLANGGICPITGTRVLRPDTVQKCLSLMDTCGMYDFSGEWAFSVGLPAKSGVSGAVLVVVPNVMGLCIWSPRLDTNGNSVRGIDFCRELVQTFNFHNYDNLVGGVDKLDPRVPKDRLRSDLIVDLCWAASEGDLDGIRRLVARGVDLNAGDYDRRTALHLAASEGHLNVVEYFVAQGANLSPLDRWGATPLDDSRREGHAAITALLEQHTG